MSITRSDWLQERRKSLGGSDASVAIGLNPYKSRYALWADKTGRLPEQEDNEAMRQGRDLEWYVAERFCEATGKKVRRHSDFIRNPMYPFAHANIDRRVVGESAGLECKTTSALNLQRYENGEFPIEYLIQCLHYLAVTGWGKWYLAALVYGTDFKSYEINRADYLDEIAEVMRVEDEFWNTFIIPDKEPPADGSQSTTLAINAVYNTTAEKSVDLSGNLEIEKVFAEIAALNSEKSVIDNEIERNKQLIKLAMGENQRADCSAWYATWKPRKDGVRVFSIKSK